MNFKKVIVLGTQGKIPMLYHSDVKEEAKSQHKELVGFLKKGPGFAQDI